MTVIICDRVVMFLKTCNGWDADSRRYKSTIQAIDDATEMKDGVLVVDIEEKPFPCRRYQINITSFESNTTEWAYL